MMYSLLSLSLFLIGTLNAQTPPGTTATGAGTTATPVTTAGAAATTGAIAGPATLPVQPEPPLPPITPVEQPPAPPVEPTVVQPVPPTGSNPVTPPANNPPVAPQQPPVRPQVPPATPQFGQPGAYNPYNPYGQPGFGGMPFINPGLVDPQVLTCELGQCRNRKITMSPGQGFKLECNMMRQCDGLDLTLNIGVDPTSFGSQVNEINDFNFDAPQNGVIIRMNNMMPGQNIEVNNINCKVPLACQNMQVLAGFGVELWEINVKCEVPGACPGCTINGQSCEMISMMTGQGHGGLAPGFGYMNQPNIPRAPAPQTGFGAPAPQQPGFGGMPQQGAPQYPQYQQPQYPQYQQPMFNPYLWQQWI